MRIDQDKLMRGLAHKFLVIYTPYVHKLTELETDSAVFYTCNGNLGELLFLPVGVMAGDELVRVNSDDILHTSDLDWCKGKFLEKKYITDDLLKIAEDTERFYDVEEKTKYLRSNGGLDPYRLKTYRDIIEVYDAELGRTVQVLPLEEGLMSIFAVRRVYPKDGSMCFGKGVFLKVVFGLTRLHVFIEKGAGI